MSFTNYTEAAKHLIGGRNKDYRPLTGSSTSLERRGPTTIAVHYHETDVVTFHEDGPTVLNSDGWRTMTTKDRMNKYSAANLWQSKGLWYVGDAPWRKEGQSVLYFDSIEVSDSGVVANPPDAGETEQFEKAKKQIDRQVSAYIKGFVKHLRELGQVDTDTSGDCWYCGMRTTSGQSLGDVLFGQDHLLSHLSEPYYVPSLLLNAMAERGYGGGVEIVISSTNHDLARTDHADDRYYCAMMKYSLRAYFRSRKVAMTKELVANNARRGPANVTRGQ